MFIFFIVITLRGVSILSREITQNCFYFLLKKAKMSPPKGPLRRKCCSVLGQCSHNNLSFLMDFRSNTECRVPFFWLHTKDIFHIVIFFTVHFSVEKKKKQQTHTKKKKTLKYTSNDGESSQSDKICYDEMKSF